MKTDILVVDDDEKLSQTVREVLERNGYGATVLHRGEEAIDAVSNDRYRLVLLDLIMPGINGIDTMMEIRRIAPRTKVIMITAFATIDSAVDAIRRGASDYISKPFKINELMTVVNRVLEEGSFEEKVKEVDIDHALTSLSNSIRRDILNSLHTHQKMRFMELVKELGIEDSRKVVFHLKILKEAGIVTQDKERLYMLTSEGKITYNSLNIFKEYLTSIKKD